MLLDDVTFIYRKHVDQVRNYIVDLSEHVLCSLHLGLQFCLCQGLHVFYKYLNCKVLGKW